VYHKVVLVADYEWFCIYNIFFLIKVDSYVICNLTCSISKFTCAELTQCSFSVYVIISLAIFTSDNPLQFTDAVKVPPFS